MEDNKTDSIKTKTANNERRENKEKKQAGEKPGDKKNAGTKMPNRDNSIDEIKKKKFSSIFSFKRVLLLLFIIFLICIGGFLLYDKEESLNSSFYFLKNIFTSKESSTSTGVNNLVEDDGMSTDSNKDSIMVMEKNDSLNTVELPESVNSNSTEVETAEGSSLTEDLVAQTDEQNTEQPNSSDSFYSERIEDQNVEAFVPQKITPVQRVLPLVTKEKRDLLKLIRNGSILVSKLSVDDLKTINGIQEEEDSADEADNLLPKVLLKLKNLVKVRKIDTERVDMEAEYKIEFRKQKLLTDFVSCSSMAAIGLYDEAIRDVKAIQNTLVQHFNVESEQVELLENITSRIKNKLKTLNEDD
jgi:hypothetical protein